jgi:hypothetical protein
VVEVVVEVEVEVLVVTVTVVATMATTTAMAIVIVMVRIDGRVILIMAMMLLMASLVALRRVMKAKLKALKNAFSLVYPHPIHLHLLETFWNSICDVL